MKKHFIAILAVMLLICCSAAASSFSASNKSAKSNTYISHKSDVTIRPVDFGDQNDYDSGGSDFDSGSDWGSDSYDDDDNDNSYVAGSTGSSGGGGSTTGGFAIAVAVVIAIIIWNIYKTKNKNNGGTTPAQPVNGQTHNVQQRAGRNVVLPDRTSEISDIIKRYDPNFSAEDFTAFARFVFVTIQDAWSNRDLQPVRIYLHDNLFNQTQRQVERKIANGVINKIENVAVSTAYLTSYRKDKNLEYLTVYLNARLTDYEVNEKTGAVLRGDPSARYELRYLLRFVRNSGVQTNEVNGDLQAHNCPNCGAPLEMSNAGKCDYCDSIITTGEYTWVLSEYSSVRDDTVDQGISVQDDGNNQGNNNPNTPAN